MVVVYSEKYKEIIENAKLRNWTKKFCKENNIIAEKHHIIPKCVSPELANDKNNIVFLTCKEHVMAHVELAISNPDDFRLVYAAARTLNYQGKDLDIEEASFIRELSRSKHLEFKHTEETKRHLSEIRTGKKLSEETKNKLKESCKGINSGSKNGMYGKPRPLNSGSKPKSIVCNEYPNLIFDSIKEAAREMKIDVRSLQRHLNSSSLKSAGKDKDGNKLTWSYVN